MSKDFDRANTALEIYILKRNVRDLEEQLHNAYKRIDELNTELIDAKRQQSVDLGRG